MSVEIKTPVGRIAWGHPLKSQNKKDQQTKQDIIKADGSKAVQWVFGVAFSKADFQQHIWPAMHQEASTVYPNNAFPPKFSWKYKDGDGVDDQGKPYASREGYAGCYVLTISTEAFAPPVYKWNGSKYDQITADQIKTGDYVSVALVFKVNVPKDRTHTPGLYVNPQAIELVGYGTEIFSASVDPMALFGGKQHQLPPGASATPIMSAPNVNMPMGGAAPMQAPGYPQQGIPGNPMTPAGAPMVTQQYAPQPAYTGPPAQAPVYPSNVAPAHDFVQNAGMQQGAPGNAPAQNVPVSVPGAPGMAPAGYAGTPGNPAMGYPSNGMPGMPGMPGGNR